MEQYSHRDRLMMISHGQKPDRYAASFWRHFFHREHYPEGTAETMLWFQKKFDWDFIKINPRADYHAEDWGLKQEWSHDEFTKHRKTAFPVTDLDDWARIKPLEPTAPVLAEHLKVISLVRKGAGQEIPILMTVFTPLSIAGRMVPNQQLLIDHIRRHPEKVKGALEAITETFVRFAAEVRNAGADGLFFATTQWASSNKLTWEEYEQFGVPYDLKVVRAAEGDALNLLHICSSHNYLKELSPIDYNSQLYNWDSNDPTNLPLDRAKNLLKGKTVVGGVDQHGWLLKNSAMEVSHRVEGIKQRYDPSWLIIGPGCSVPPEVPLENLQAVRDTL